jgi:hypothetical protein
MEHHHNAELAEKQAIPASSSQDAFSHFQQLPTDAKIRDRHNE